jgi:hypothetical protein
MSSARFKGQAVAGPQFEWSTGLGDTVATRGATWLRDAMPRVADGLRRGAEPGPAAISSGASTGLADLDEVSTGLHPGEVWLIEGSRGSGRTALALTIARAALADAADRWVVWGCGRESAEKLAIRLVAQMSGLPVWPGGAVDGSQEAAITAAMNAARDLPISVTGPDAKVADLRRQLREGRTAPALVVADDLEVARTPWASGSSALRGIARDHWVPVIVVGLADSWEASDDPNVWLRHKGHTRGAVGDWVESVWSVRRADADQSPREIRLWHEPTTGRVRGADVATPE